MGRVLTLVIVAMGVLAAQHGMGEEAAAVTRGAVKLGAGDWSGWRGTRGNGVADGTQRPLVKWSKTENVLWRAPIVGRGHSSPIVVGERVIVATAEEDREVQSVVCFNKDTGAVRWQVAVHQGGMDRKGNKKTTQASSTAASDGERVFVNFLNQGAIYTTALDLEGKQVWQTKVSDFVTHQGFGSSPMVMGSLVFVTTDSRGGGVVAALDCGSGKVVWEANRPEKANYASASVLTAAGKEQLVVHGCDLISSFEPLTGKKLWEVDGGTTECVTTVVTDGTRVFASGGWPRKHVQAVMADGSGTTAWENGSSVYVPSMVVHQGCLFAVQDSGVATCWKCETGEELWKERLGGTFTASLVLVGENIYATNEAGQTFIFKATPEKFEKVAENKLGDEVYATPTICGGRIYMRVVENVEGRRQEMVYCLGEK